MEELNTPAGDPKLFMYSGDKTPIVKGGAKDNEIHYWNNEVKGEARVLVNEVWTLVATPTE